jgi:hypothetical protein
MKSQVLVLALITVLGIVAPSSAYSILAPKHSASVSLPRKPVKSSNIASIGYDAQSKTLEVEFLNGTVYQYYNVPVSVYQGLMNAQSHGGYLADNVKDAGYQYRRVQ